MNMVNHNHPVRMLTSHVEHTQKIRQSIRVEFPNAATPTPTSHSPQFTWRTIYITHTILRVRGLRCRHSSRAWQRTGNARIVSSQFHSNLFSSGKPKCGWLALANWNEQAYSGRRHSRIIPTHLGLFMLYNRHQGHPLIFPCIREEGCLYTNFRERNKVHRQAHTREHTFTKHSANVEFQTLESRAGTDVYYRIGGISTAACCWFVRATREIQCVLTALEMNFCSQNGQASDVFGCPAQRALTVSIY